MGPVGLAVYCDCKLYSGAGVATHNTERGTPVRVCMVFLGAVHYGRLLILWLRCYWIYWEWSLFGRNT